MNSRRESTTVAASAQSLARAAENLGVWRHALGDPDVAADHGVFPDHGVAPEDGSARVDRHVVFDGRMALLRERGSGALVAPRAQGAQGHALVNLHVVADVGGRPDHDAGAMVNEKALTDARSRVNVDPGSTVGVFADDARNHRYVRLVEHV